MSPFVQTFENPESTFRPDSAGCVHSVTGLCLSSPASVGFPDHKNAVCLCFSRCLSCPEAQPRQKATYLRVFWLWAPSKGNVSLYTCYTISEETNISPDTSHCLQHVMRSICGLNGYFWFWCLQETIPPNSPAVFNVYDGEIVNIHKSWKDGIMDPHKSLFSMKNYHNFPIMFHLFFLFSCFFKKVKLSHFILSISLCICN